MSLCVGRFVAHLFNALQFPIPAVKWLRSAVLGAVFLDGFVHLRITIVRNLSPKRRSLYGIFLVVLSTRSFAELHRGKSLPEELFFAGDSEVMRTPFLK